MNFRRMVKSKFTIFALFFVIVGCSKYYRVKSSSVLREEGINSINYPKNSLHELDVAFEEDGYKIVELTTFQGKRGIKAKSKTASNYESKKNKVIYYVEGTGYQMGYLLGKLAYDQIKLMSDDFLNGIVPAFLKPGSSPETRSIFGELLMKNIMENDKAISKTIPQQLLDNGIGIPAEIDIYDSGAFGFELVTMLGEGQLGGTLSLDRSKGTKFELTWEI